jgi:hypothetical protein
VKRSHAKAALPATRFTQGPSGLTSQREKKMALAPCRSISPLALARSFSRPGSLPKPGEERGTETAPGPVADLIPGDAPGGGGGEGLPELQVTGGGKAPCGQHHDGGGKGQGKAGQERGREDQPEAVLRHQ